MLEVRSIFKTFNPGSADANAALKGLSLSLAERDFITVVGGNGSGKSTLLNAVAGVFPVDSGEININGTNVTKMPDYKRAGLLGRVFQDPFVGSASNMEIQENMALALRRGKRRGLRWGITKQEKVMFRESLARLGLGLENRMTAKVGLLSGGQRQALTLLMAAIRKPRVLLLDEHTAALDPKTAAKVLEISAEIIQNEHLTTLMVTHNMRDAINFGNRIMMMREGGVIFEAEGEQKKALTIKEMVERFNDESVI